MDKQTYVGLQMAILCISLIIFCFGIQQVSLISDIIMMNPYQTYNSTEAIPNCEGCNLIFAPGIASAIVTQCGHFFCQERCEKYINISKKCLSCEAYVQEGSLKKEKMNKSVFKYGNNKYMMAVLHPIRQISMKKEMDGSALLKDFIHQFPPVEEILNMQNTNYYILITHKQGKYADLKNKSLDQLKEEFSLVTMNQNNCRVNRIMLNPANQGGNEEETDL